MKELAPRNPVALGPKKVQGLVHSRPDTPRVQILDALGRSASGGGLGCGYPPPETGAFTEDSPWVLKLVSILRLIVGL